MHRLTCPVHGLGRSARAYRRRLADQDAAGHIAWAAHLRDAKPVTPRLPTVVELANELSRHTDGIPPHPAVRRPTGFVDMRLAELDRIEES